MVTFSNFHEGLSRMRRRRSRKCDSWVAISSKLPPKSASNQLNRASFSSQPITGQGHASLWRHKLPYFAAPTFTPFPILIFVARLRLINKRHEKRQQPFSAQSGSRCGCRTVGSGNMTISYTNRVSRVRLLGFTRLLLLWKASIYKLLYREILIYAVLYTTISLLYRLVLNPEQKKWVEVEPVDFFIFFLSSITRESLYLDRA